MAGLRDAWDSVTDHTAHFFTSKLTQGRHARDIKTLQREQYRDGLRDGTIKDPKAPPEKLVTRRNLMRTGLIAGGLFALYEGYEYGKEAVEGIVDRFHTAGALAPKHNETRVDFTKKVNDVIDHDGSATVYDAKGHQFFEIKKDGDIYQLYRLNDKKQRVDQDPLFTSTQYMVSAVSGLLTTGNTKLSDYAKNPADGASFKQWFDKILSEQTASAAPVTRPGGSPNLGPKGMAPRGLA